jgi:hypothetical protein
MINGLGRSRSGWVRGGELGGVVDASDVVERWRGGGRGGEGVEMDEREIDGEKRILYARTVMEGRIHCERIDSRR